MIVLTLEGFNPEPWIFWILKVSLVFSTTIGAVALLCPQMFSRIATFGATWVDTTAAFEQADRPVFVDRHFVAHSRLFGTAVIAGAATCVWLTPPGASWAWITWYVSAGVSLIGVLAILRPSWFEQLAYLSARWVDTSRFFKWLDRRIDIDALVLGHSRAFGGIVLASVVIAMLMLFR